MRRERVGDQVLVLTVEGRLVGRDEGGGHVRQGRALDQVAVRGEEGGQHPVGDLGAGVGAGTVLDVQVLFGQERAEDVPDGSAVDHPVGVDRVGDVVRIDEVAVEAPEALALLRPREQAGLVPGALLEGHEVGEEVAEALVVGPALGRGERGRGLLVEHGVAVLVDDAAGVLALVDPVRAHAHVDRRPVPEGVVDGVGVDGHDGDRPVPHLAEAQAIEVGVGPVDPVVGHGVLETGAGPARGPGAVVLHGGLDRPGHALGVDERPDQAPRLGIVQVLDGPALEGVVGLGHVRPLAAVGVDGVGQEQARRGRRTRVAGVAVALEAGRGREDRGRDATRAPGRVERHRAPLGAGRGDVDDVAPLGVHQHDERAGGLGGGDRHRPGQRQLGTGTDPDQLRRADLVGHAGDRLAGAVLGLGVVDGVVDLDGCGVGEGVAGPLDLAVLEHMDHQLGALDRVLVDDLAERHVGDRRARREVPELQGVPLLIGEIGLVLHPVLGDGDDLAFLVAEPVPGVRRLGRRRVARIAVVARTAREDRQAEAHQDDPRQP